MLAAGLAGCSSRGNSDTQPTAATTEIEKTPPTTAKTPTTTPPPSPTKTPTSSPTPTQTETPQKKSMVEVNGVPVHRNHYSLQEVSFQDLPTVFYGRWQKPKCRINAELAHTLPNLQMTTINGDKGHMPVRTSRTMMKLLFCYRQFQRKPYLDKTKEISRAYMDTGTRSEGAVYFPYTMKKGGAGVTMYSPWYSSLSQGTSLSAYIRLYRASGDKRYRKIADSVYESFKQLKRETDPWIAMVDNDNYLWFEEYPHNPPTHVLNGFITGIFGLYEYWLRTKTDESRALLEASITTVQHYLDEFRVPGEVSWYALNHGYRGNEFYHAMHILQLRKLYLITNETYFKKMEKKFNKDNPEQAGIPKHARG
jgi:hypothetical protein